jgi:hypothetical protein
MTRYMANIVIGFISFAAIFGGVLIGLFAGRRLPGPSSEQ